MAHSIEITSIDDQIQTKKDETEEERNVDLFIEKKETNAQDRSRLQTNKSAKQFFGEKFKDLNNLCINSITIFRVTVGLSESNPNAYKPKLISIGPYYHNKNLELRSTERYKMMYLQRFLRRKEGIDVESCISEMDKLKDDAIKCYDDIEDLDSDILENFSKMLLLDGSFVVEFIREYSGMKPKGEAMIIKRGCIYNQVRRDLLLVENQLPFFVLTKLHDMTKEGEISFTKDVKSLFSDIFLSEASLLEDTEGNEKNMKHLLHVVHMSYHPSEMKITSRNPSMGAENSSKSLCWNPLQIIRTKDMPRDEDDISWINVMPNVTELIEAGVCFEKVKNIEDRKSLFDIKFENGLMTIPCFQVEDDTETILRNFIAYEQQSSDVHSTHFTDFAIIMDQLIESDKDVNLLRQKEIIHNWMGEDKEVARLFNNIGNGVSISSDFYYDEECGKAVQYCKKPWNRMKANLRHNYFSSPWVGASTVAAIILLVLTAMQTILAFTGGVK